MIDNEGLGCLHFQPFLLMGNYQSADSFETLKY